MLYIMSIVVICYILEGFKLVYEFPEYGTDVPKHVGLV
jgi:hypothetical protein